MKSFTVTTIVFIFCFSAQILAQDIKEKKISMVNLIEIIRAEDELRYDHVLENFMKSEDSNLRKRAALAAGRIGNEEAVPLLEELLDKDLPDVRQMAAFAIGEIESMKGVRSIVKTLRNTRLHSDIRARAVEAAGKIVAANGDDEKSKMLGSVILDSLVFEANNRSQSSDRFILFGVTAALRARLENAEDTLVRFLTHSNWRIRADTLNTLARLRVKGVNGKARELLKKDVHPIVRAKAARLLEGSNDIISANVLLDRAINDKDLRVRVNAIRALGSLKRRETASKLIERAKKLFTKYKKSKYANPPEENELLTIASSLGNILKGTNDNGAIKFLDDFRKTENHSAPETEVALVRISPRTYAKTVLPKNVTWIGKRGVVQGLGEAANLEDDEDVKKLRKMAKSVLSTHIRNANEGRKKPDKSFPSILNAYAGFKTDDLSEVLRDSLRHDDEIIRATAAALLGDVKLDKGSDRFLENYFALREAFMKSQNDKLNDASISILNAIKKQYKKLSKDKSIKTDLLNPIKVALDSADYFVRRRAFEIFRQLKITPNIYKKHTQVSFSYGKHVKSRVIRANYIRAASRKNGNSKAILLTEKGEITISFFPEDAPLTVDNFIKLAKSGYFNGLRIHRVVPNFVVQDGDVRGDGNGGPGWQIRCEINQLPYKRGMVGMALAGKDSGGSQWFVTHSPQPHLDGGYTVFGKVTEKDMKIVDKLVRGDKILDVRVVEK